MTFNLLTEKWNVLTDAWLDCIAHDGKAIQLSPLAVLARGSEFRCIDAASPLDYFAAIRFLLTLLYWKADAAGGVDNIRQSLLNGSTPPAVLKAISDEQAQFELFDERAPFMQDATVRDTGVKSAGSPFAEFACGTNIAHFHHGDDSEARICLRCATKGLLRIVPWSQAGGAGLSPAVHNAPPVVAQAVGSNIAATLGLNLVPLQGEPGNARWSGHFKPGDTSKPVPYMEALTWNPRRVHLGELQPIGRCWRCGDTDKRLVGPIVYAKNEHTKLDKEKGKTKPFQWRDPAAFYGADSPFVTFKSFDESRAASGRDLAGLLKKGDQGERSAAVGEANSAHNDWRLVVPCTNPANNKTYDHRAHAVSGLSPDAIRKLVPPEPPPWQQSGMNGWTDPRHLPVGAGAIALVRRAVRHLNYADWLTLASAAYHTMEASPAAFDILTGLWWPLRKRVSNIPSRNAAWLTLKLMAAAPAQAREPHTGAFFCPLEKLATRQLSQPGPRLHTESPYPVSLPRGLRLEAALRAAIETHVKQRTAPPIDWVGLCSRLDILLR